MYKHFITFILALVILLFGMTTGAVDSPTANQLLDAMPTELRIQARAGASLDSKRFPCCDGTICLKGNEGTRYILSHLPDDTAQSALYGVFDFASGELVLPFAYDDIFFIPDGRFFLVKSAGDTTAYYETEADGTIHPTPLPIDGHVESVDREGYVTLSRAIEVTSANGMESGRYYQMALLDNHYEPVIDYAAEGVWPSGIVFRNGYAILQTGSTQWTADHSFFIGNGTYGIIDRRGNWIGRHDYAEMTWDPFSEIDRIFAERDGQWYVLMANGQEMVPLSAPYSDFRKQYSPWAKSALEQARERRLLPAKLDDYYTLDISRAEFCTLIVQLYSALGNDGSATEQAPVFIDCDDEDIRTAAALGIVSGYEDRTFRPYNRITRAEAAAMLNRFYTLFREPDETAHIPYQDDAALGAWAKPHIYAMQNAGIMNGTANHRFAPTDYYTIEQAVSTVNRLYDALESQ